jgi:hypothetical protein
VRRRRPHRPCKVSRSVAIIVHHLT